MKKHLFIIMSLAWLLFSCKPDPVVPTVITLSVTEITENSAKSGGEVTSDGGAEVTARGVCWSKNQKPTMNDFRTSDGSGIGLFNSNMSELEDSTTYYVRAYAVNSAGTTYGNEISFTTLAIDDDDDDDDDDDENEILLPTVLVLSVEDITENSAVSGGEVTSDGGAEVTARGVCWSTSQNPTIEDALSNDGTGVGVYSSNISNLTSNTTYYVRAYATNSEGTAYSEELSFTTLEEIVLYPPTVITAQVTEIGQTTAVSGGEVTSDGGAEVTARGVCWSTSQNPTIEDAFSNDGTGVGAYISNLTDLIDYTTYYVRAYATNSEGTAYGEEISFTTLDDGFINGYEYVDLGLPSGVKWATLNVGATAPTERGSIFAWGELEAKAEYLESNCTTYGLNFDISGNPEYDAARAQWGGTWRMPTREEYDELFNNCTWEWEVQNGVGGKKVTGPNGNYIFMPITGYQYGASHYMEDFGYYWTSTPVDSYDNLSFDFFFDMEYNLSIGWDDRCYGQPIRPVTD